MAPKFPPPLTPTTNILTLLLTFFFLSTTLVLKVSCSGTRAGKWELLLNSSGVVAMHMALTHRNTVVMFDQKGTGRSGFKLLPGKQCNKDYYSPSCWAHSVEYDIATNKIRPLTLETDTWCSSGSFFSNGTLVQTGGWGTGSKRIRYFEPCSNGNCDWRESKSVLADSRWYSSNQILPGKEEQMIIVGGRNVFTYEFVPKTFSQETAFQLPFLRKTLDPKQEGNNLYPFLHLSSDGNLFIFANRESILFDYKKRMVVKSFPSLPGKGSRSYPSSGSSVMLPLDHEDGFQRVEIMVCGGAANGSYRAAHESRRFLDGLSSCGRLVITEENPKWVMEEMPGPRLMNDMVVLPIGDILMINGAKQGSAGWGNAVNPSFQPYLYRPTKVLGKRFHVLNSTHVPRMYHSSAILLPDGRVLVAGSNPNDRYSFTKVPFPTELRVQAFVPYYMGSYFDPRRAFDLNIGYSRNGSGAVYGEEFSVDFELERRPSKVVQFHVYAPPFTTHSISMNQRMLKLKCKSLMREKDGRIHARLSAPDSANVAPAGYYLLTVINGGIPSKAQWVRFVH